MSLRVQSELREVEVPVFDRGEAESVETESRSDKHLMCKFLLQMFVRDRN